ncbi:hypothetical protein Tco_0856357 [Tanacetum coccineum]|uniref:Uncharacterized protein n=1 Tax=Tanacetum coccineum TaxID=301880 RepID=A0ABQ5B337_9ASTR
MEASTPDLTFLTTKQKRERQSSGSTLIGWAAPRYIWDRHDRHQETLGYPVYKYCTILRRKTHLFSRNFHLKALDEGYSSKNYVRKFLRARHPKLRAKVTVIEKSKYLTSLSLDELIRNLKVHEMIIKKDFEIVKAKGERKSLALKAKKESSDEEYNLGTTKRHSKEVETTRKAKVIGSVLDASDNGEEDDQKANEETWLVAQASSEACRLDEQNPRCLKDWESLDFQDLVVNGECFQVEVHCCGGENSRKYGASLSLDDEEEEEITEEETIFFPFSLLGFLEMSRGSMTCSWNVNLASGTMA